MTDQPYGTVRHVADRLGLRALLRLRRRRGQPVVPSPLGGHDRRRAAEDPGGGLSLTEDLADHAIGWVRSQKALMPDKPFFMYFAPGSYARPAPRAKGHARSGRRGPGNKAVVPGVSPRLAALGAGPKMV